MSGINNPVDDAGDTPPPVLATVGLWALIPLHVEGERMQRGNAIFYAVHTDPDCLQPADVAYTKARLDERWPLRGCKGSLIRTPSVGIEIQFEPDWIPHNTAQFERVLHTLIQHIEAR